MWVMIIKEIPVEKEYKPEFLGIYWTTPWEVNVERMKNFLSKHKEYHSKLGKKFEKNSAYFIAKNAYEKDVKMANFVFKHKNELVNYFGKEKLFYDSIGAEPNEFGKKQVLIKSKPVGIFPHEFSEITKENMRVYLTEGSHEFESSNIAREEIELMTKQQKKVYDAALVDGCDIYQANLVAVGKDPQIDFPPPLGWYKCREEYKEYFQR